MLLDVLLADRVLAAALHPLLPAKTNLMGLGKASRPRAADVAARVLALVDKVPALTASMAFDYLYRHGSARDAAVVRKHLLYVVSLLDAKKVADARRQLAVLYRVVAGNDGGSDWLDCFLATEGIPVSLPFPAPLVVALNFIHLQAFLASYKTTRPRDTVATLRLVATLLLSRSAFSQWLSDALPKHLANLLKLVGGLSKITSHAQRSHPQLSVVQLALTLKAAEYSARLGGAYSCAWDAAFASEWLAPFVDDLRLVAPQFGPMPLLSLPQKVVDRIREHPTEETLFQLAGTTHFGDADPLYLCQLLLVLWQCATPAPKHLDWMTIQLKQLIQSGTHLEECLGLLTEMYAHLAPLADHKRIRNASNLLFNLGSRLTSPRRCWERCLECEQFIYQQERTDQNLSIWRNKLEKTANALYERGEFEVACRLILAFVSCAHELAQAPLLTQLMVKCIVSNASLADHLWGLQSAISQTLQTSLYIRIVQLLEKSNNATEKTDIVNYITRNLARFDASARLECLYHYYNVNGLTNYLHWELPLEVSHNDLLWLSGICLAGPSGDKWTQAELAANHFKSWARHAPHNNAISQQIFTQLVTFMGLHGRRETFDELINDVAVAKWCSGLDRVTSILISARVQLRELASGQVHALLRTSGELMKQAGSLSVNVQQLVDWKLVQFEYCLAVESTDCPMRYQALLHFIDGKVNLDDGAMPLDVKFRNMLLVGRLRYLCGKYFSSIGDDVAAYDHYRTCIKIHHSLVRRTGNNLPMRLYLEVKWESSYVLSWCYGAILQCCVRLGLSSDLDYHLGEYEKLVSLMSPQWRAFHHDRLALVYLMMGCYDKVRALTRTDTVDQVLKVIAGAYGSESVADAPTSIQLDYLHSLINHEIVPRLVLQPANLRLLVLELLMRHKGEMLLASQKGAAASLIPTHDALMNLQYAQSGALATFEHKDMVDTLLWCSLLLQKQESVLIELPNLVAKLAAIKDSARSKPFVNQANVYRSISSSLTPAASKNTTSELPSDADLWARTDAIPNTWCVVSIDYCELSDELVFFRYNNGAHTLKRVPLCRNTTHKDTLTFEQCVEDFRAIIKRSDLSTRSETTSSVVTKEQRQDWWRTRFFLDLLLKELIEKVEVQWLGGFTGLFQGTSDVDWFLLESEVNCAIEGRSVSRDDIHLCLAAFSAQDGRSEEKIEDILAHSCGKLAESVRAKLTAIFAKWSRKYQSWSEHLVIIPSATCAFFPWESLTSMNGMSVSRMPSMRALVDSLLSCPASMLVFDNGGSENLYYLINPEGDLKRTEANFAAMFSARDWKGSVGTPPQPGQLLSDLLRSDLFIYLGHGGCEQFIRTSDMLKQTCTGGRLPPSLLIGCSSGALSYNGLLEPHGNVYNWLNGGAPMMVVNLWDVTDKDIDTFSLSVMERWGLVGNEASAQNICQAVTQSRQRCTLKYLNGCAPVVYGLPLNLRPHSSEIH